MENSVLGGELQLETDIDALIGSLSQLTMGSAVICTV